MKLYLETDNASFSGVRTGIVDTYTVLGGTPGDTLNFNAVFVLEGTSVTLPRPNSEGDYFGHSNVDVGVGIALTSNGAAFGSNPVIDAPFGRISETYQLVVGSQPFRPVYEFQEVDFTGANRIETVIPLSVVIGQAFDLSFYVNLDHTGDLETDMLNTAFVEFELGPDYSISSVKGFGTTADSSEPVVPEPTSLALCVLGSMGMGVIARRRRQR